MESQIPTDIAAQFPLDKFFEQLPWWKLEDRIREALKYPGRSVPTEILCPAVMDLARQVMGEIGELAIQKPGARVSYEETFSFDQRLAVMRLLEAIISEYEEWKGKHTLALEVSLSTIIDNRQKKDL
jgi:hypothetical protein